MKLSKILLLFVVIALLASNGVLIYQNNQNKSKIDKLQTNMISVQKAVKTMNTNVSNTDSDVQGINSAIGLFCGNFTTFACP